MLTTTLKSCIIMISIILLNETYTTLYSIHLFKKSKNLKSNISNDKILNQRWEQRNKMFVLTEI